MNNLNTQNNLAILAEKESEIDSEITEELSKTNFSIIEIFEYTEEENEKIDELKRLVNEVDNLIKAGKPFQNSLAYNLFVIGYNELSDKIKKHFEEKYKDLRIKYLSQKIYNIESGSGKGVGIALKNYKAELAELLK